MEPKQLRPRPKLNMKMFAVMGVIVDVIVPANLEGSIRPVGYLVADGTGAGVIKVCHFMQKQTLASRKLKNFFLVLPRMRWRGGQCRSFSGICLPSRSGCAWRPRGGHWSSAGRMSCWHLLDGDRGTAETGACVPPIQALNFCLFMMSCRG